MQANAAPLHTMSDIQAEITKRQQPTGPHANARVAGGATVRKSATVVYKHRRLPIGEDPIQIFTAGGRQILTAGLRAIRPPGSQTVVVIAPHTLVAPGEKPGTDRHLMEVIGHQPA